MAFVLGVAILVIVAAMVLLLRRTSTALRAADRDDPNLAWLRTREEELETTDAALVEEARLRLIEDGLADSEASPASSARRFPVLALFIVLIVAAGAIYWQTGAVEDVLIYRALGSISPEDSEEKRSALIERIAARSAARPDNLQYHGLLGQLYMAGQNFPEAQASFERLAEGAPEDPQALARAAQARFLAQGRNLDDAAQLYAERALAVDPTQRTALGLLGMASFEAGQFNAAVSYWERLQALEAPDSAAYEMLEDVLNLARERSGVAGVAQTEAQNEAQPEAADDDALANGDTRSGISVDLSFGVAAEADPTAVVFVFARPAGAGGMPVAVRRLAAGELPLTLRLSDADAMMGLRLSQAGEVMVTAQVSANGQPGEANALFTGVAGPIVAGGDDVSVSIELRPSDERS